MNEKYKITFLDKRRYRTQLGIIIFFGIIFILTIISVKDYILYNMPMPSKAILACFAAPIVLCYQIYKYNKKDLSYYIIDNKSIYHRTFLGRKIKEIYWNDVKEVGLGRYLLFDVMLETIYVSTKPLTEKEKYKSMKYGVELKEEVMLIRYTKEALYAIEEFYSGEIMKSDERKYGNK